MLLFFKLDNFIMWNNEMFDKKISRMIGKKFVIIAVAFLNLMFLGQNVSAKDLRLLESRALRYSGPSSSDSNILSHIVVIDAGSTGNRVFAFRFVFHSAHGLILSKEDVDTSKPALGSGTTIEQKGEAIQKLVNYAKSKINPRYQATTPIYLQGTAGLRILPYPNVEPILDKCREVLRHSSFAFPQSKENEYVSILDEDLEGIFSWVTVNYLLERISPQNTANLEYTVATLDLGGASGQVTFIPTEECFESVRDKIRNFHIFDTTFNIYTNSYLGMGINEVRREILSVGATSRHNQNNMVRWECMNPNIGREFVYDGRNFEISNYDRYASKKRFNKCLQLVKQFTNQIAQKPVGLQDKDIYAFSNFYFKASKVKNLNILIIFNNYVF